MLGLDFGLPVFKLNYFKYFLHFEKLYNALNKQNILESIDNARNQIRAIASKYFYNFKPYKNRCAVFSRKDFNNLRNLAQNSELYVTKPDKGNGVVIMNKQDYCDKINTILNDETKFSLENIDEKKLILKLEDKMNETLRSMKNKNIISKDMYESCTMTGSRLGSLYGLPKVHKDNCPLRPIVSACGTHNYKLAKFFVNILSHLDLGPFVIKNSREFVDSIKAFTGNNRNFFMCSFDVESLYTNVPVQETIDIILDKLYSNTNEFYGMTKEQIRKLFNIVFNDTYFKFSNNIFKQCDGLAMGSPASPLAANLFLSHLEQHFINNCPHDFKPLFYRRYLDDTFVIFNNESQAQDFFNYVNRQHCNIKFTMETENQNSLSFLDVTVTRENGQLSTTVFRKKTFTGQGTNFFSNIYHRYKISVIKTLIHRAFELSSNYCNFNTEIEFLRKYFTDNMYPVKIFNCTLRKFLNLKYETRQRTTTVARQTQYIGLPYIGADTNKLIYDLRKVINRFYPQLNLIFFFKNNLSAGSLFKKHVGEPDMMLRSNIVYKYSCDCCQRSYIGSTKLQMFIRCAHHAGVSHRTGRPYNNPSYSAIREHCSSSRHCFKFSNFSIIDTCNSSEYDLRILETLHINKSKPVLNRNLTAMQLNIV